MKDTRDTEIPPSLSSTTATANPGYALAELDRALAAGWDAKSAEERDNAAKRERSWRSVIAGMTSGTLAIGSRTPVKDTPAWATLEIAHGGFATGARLAGGPLLPHERELLAKIGSAPHGVTERAHLNTFFLGDEGRALLTEMLVFGTFRVNVPEEAALLVVAWLVEQREAERAEEILDAITPFIGELRFYPVPDARPLRATSVVSVSTVGAQKDALHKKATQPHVARMNETLRVWLPLYDRVVALFLETVSGPPPSFVKHADGTLALRPDKQPILQGGVPGARFPEGFRERAQAISEARALLQRTHPEAKKPGRGNMGVLLDFAGRYAADRGESLAARDVASLRRALAAFVTKHGAPGSAKHTQIRTQQRAWAKLPLHRDFARVVSQRLDGYPRDAGLASLEGLDAMVTETEARSIDALDTTGFSIPAHLIAPLERCLEGSVDDLVARKIVTSGETLAKLLPQVTSQVRALGIASPELRRVYAAVYSAFRKRRSLLLLNLESQIKIGELPWVAAIEQFRAKSGSAANDQAAARAALEQIVTLHITAFPATIFPNKLVTELAALAKSAGLDIPFTNELATDIFMGTLTPKFAAAAKIAADLLGSSAYARYYGIPYDRVRAFGTHGVPAEAELVALCGELAGRPPGSWGTPAENGTIIEQQQIITTHNLAALFAQLDLHHTLAAEMRHLAELAFRFVCKSLTSKLPTRSSQLRMLKDSAYAFRQMMFFLSFVSEDELFAFMLWAEETLSALPPEIHARFSPAWRGLSHVLAGGAFDESKGLDHARRFLGWTTARHWLLPADGVTRAR